MMESYKVECTSKKEIIKNVIQAEFNYQFVCREGMGLVSSRCSEFFSIVTAAEEDFQLIWTLKNLCDFEGCKLTEIKLEKSDRKFFGNLTIKDYDDPRVCIKSNIEWNSLPFQEKILGVVFGDYINTINICINIFYENVDKKAEKHCCLVTDDYDNFFQNKTFRDVTFVLGNEEITAHKQIISARNDIFTKMFDSEMVEKKNNRVEIMDIEPSIFKLLLRFIYSGKIDSKDTEDLLKLIVAADKYSVIDLVSICSHRLLNNLSINNVVYTLTIADLVKADFLKAKCIAFIMKNKYEVFHTESYKEIIVEGGRDELIAEIQRT